MEEIFFTNIFVMWNKVPDENDVLALDDAERMNSRCYWGQRGLYYITLGIHLSRKSQYYKIMFP